MYLSSTFPRFSSGLSSDPTTRRLFYAVATAHDLESHDTNSSALYATIQASQWGQLAIACLWAAGNLFHVGWQGNYGSWVTNPLKTLPIAHAIWDPHFGSSALKAFTNGGVSYPVNIATSGIYNWCYTVGMRSNNDIYDCALGLLLASIASLLLGRLTLTHSYRQPYSTLLPLRGVARRKQPMTQRATPRIGAAVSRLGQASLLWAGHLVHVAIPAGRGNAAFTQMTLLERFLEPLPGGLPHPAGLRPISSMNWGVYAENPDSPTHIFGTSEGAGTAILTFIGGFHPQTRSLWLTDIAHHHLAIGILFSVAGVVLSNTIDIKSRLNRTVPMTCVAKQKLRVPVDTTITSMHLDLAINLATLGVLTSLTAQHMYSLPAYAFISSSLLTQSALYIHHQYIAGFLMVGSFAHAAIFLVRDYHPSLESYSAITWLLRNKSAVISLLSWVSLFLGFHTLGLYVHNDTCVALGNPEKQILIEPLFAQYIQIASGKSAEAYGLEPFSREFRGGSVEQLEKYLATTQTGVIKPATNPLWLPGWLNGVNGSTGPNIFLTIGPGDFLVHHAISLGVHTTTLILLKGALDARSSEMIPDKVDLGFSFPCDGPGRGGTCDVSAWDSVYLAVFWELNTTGWTTFYWHWKHLTIWGGNPGSFNESSTYLMGWFRDYLWTNSTPVITGYTPNAMSSQSAWTWMFLFGHLIWATGFMFLISWRGYWQELIETIVWAHERTPIANLVSWSDKPVALSIVQARLVGLAHFATGYIATYAPFTTASNTAAMAQTQTFELREIISRSSLRIDSLSDLNVLA